MQETETETKLPPAPTGESGPMQFVFLAAVTYDGLQSGRTRLLAEALVDLGHTVTFVDKPNTRIAARNGFRFGPPRRADAGVDVLRLPPLPWPIRARWPALSHLWAADALRRLRRHDPNVGGAVVVTSTPWWLPVVEAMPHAACVYDCIDHVEVHAGTGRLAYYEAWDRRLLAQCRLVTTVSEPLRRHLAERLGADRIRLIPNGVLDRWMDAPVEAADRSRLSDAPDRPLIGFIGALFEWIDVDLIRRAADALPDYRFALIGPPRPGVSLASLDAAANVRVLPAIPFADVPRHIQAFDACLIPFTPSIVSAYADPLKLYEYCAFGKPVISTIRFETGGRPAPIDVAPSPQEFIAAIRRAVEQRDEAGARRRIEFARGQTWQRRARDFAAACRGSSALAGKTIKA